MEKLKFLSTMSAEEFKAQNGISKLDILKNVNSGKQFFAWKTGSGAISTKFSMNKEAMVSQVQGECDDEPFYLLHNKSEGATLLGTL